MAGAQITFGKLESGEYVGMREAMQRFQGCDTAASERMSALVDCQL